MRLSHLWLLTLAPGFFSAASAAQQTTTMSAGSAGGISTVSVRVTYQQNHRPAPGLRVELISPMGGMAGIRSTDGNGGATFDGVGSGHYQVEVSGPGIETTKSEVFETGGTNGGPNITERIEVRSTQTASGVAPGQFWRQTSQRLPRRNSTWARRKWTRSIGREPRIIFKRRLLCFRNTQRHSTVSHWWKSN